MLPFATPFPWRAQHLPSCWVVPLRIQNWRKRCFQFYLFHRCSLLVSLWDPNSFLFGCDGPSICKLVLLAFIALAIHVCLAVIHVFVAILYTHVYSCCFSLRYLILQVLPHVCGPFGFGCRVRRKLRWRTRQMRHTFEQYQCRSRRNMVVLAGSRCLVCGVSTVGAGYFAKEGNQVLLGEAVSIMQSD